MKILVGGGLAFCLISGGWAQTYRSGGVVSGFGTNSGFGSVVFPAGRPTIGTPFTLTNPNFSRTLGNVVAGRPAFSGIPSQQRLVQGFGHRNTGAGIVYVPYAYPVYSGGYYGYGEMAPPQQPNVTVIYPPQQTPVIINQVPMQPLMHEYVGGPGPSSTPAEPTQQSEASYYLLAFTDHSIYSAVGYWVDGDTLHYITSGNVHNQASLALIDRDLTERLNKGRGVQVNLPR